ncbi:MAG: hypothetical protein ACTHJX_01225 [Terriglobales bacterium]
MRIVLIAAFGLLATPALALDQADQLTTPALTCMALAGQAGRLDEMDRLFAYAKKTLHSVWPQERAQLRAMTYGPHYLTEASEDYMLGSMAGSIMAAVDETLATSSDKLATASKEFDKAHCSTVGK